MRWPSVVPLSFLFLPTIALTSSLDLPFYPGLTTYITVLYCHGWVGLTFPKKCAGPGTKGLASICPCFFVLNLHKKVQGIAKGFRAVLTYARSYAQKALLGPPVRHWRYHPYTKTCQKHQNPTPIANDSGAHFTQ